MTRHSNDAGIAFKETIEGAIGSVILLALVNAFPLPIEQKIFVYLLDFVMSVISAYLLGFEGSIFAILGTVFAFYVLLAGKLLGALDMFVVLGGFGVGLYLRYKSSR